MRTEVDLVGDAATTDLLQVEEFVRSHPNGNYFQSPSLYELYSKTLDYLPILLTARNHQNVTNGVLLAVIQKEKGLVKGPLSSRCLVVGGPLVENNDLQVASELINKLTDEVRNASIYIEFRNLFIGDSFRNLLTESDYEELEYYNYVVPIASLEENRRKLSASRRTQIKKAIKNGAKIVVPVNLDQIREFHTILSLLYTTKVKKPLPPFDFFANFFNDGSHGRYFLVEYSGKVIGGIMCPIYKDTISEWYICGLDKEHKDLYPSVLATWAPIEYGANNGLGYFDFMGAGRSNEGYGVRDFKSKFGGELVTYKRFLKVNSKLLYNIGKAGLKLSSFFR